MVHGRIGRGLPLSKADSQLRSCDHIRYSNVDESETDDERFTSPTSYATFCMTAAVCLPPGKFKISDSAYDKPNTSSQRRLTHGPSCL